MEHDDGSRFEDGIVSHRAGGDRDENPYSRWTSEWVEWLAGWNVSAQEQARETEPLTC